MVTLWITDRQSVCTKRVRARVGMKVSGGRVISRVTDKTIWTTHVDGTGELQHRRIDGRLPTTKASYVRQTDYV